MGAKNGQRDPVETITTNVAEQPVVRAWRTLAAATEAPAPERVEVLRRRNKSVVYRLPGVGHGRGDVIAKHCVRDSALAECAVYLVLEELPVSHPEYYGYVEGEQDGFGWLFLGDAAGEPFEPEAPAQRALATHWLATLHTTSSGTSAAARLADRGPTHYWQHLAEGRAAIDGMHAGREISAAEDAILDDVRLWLDRVESRWTEIEAICRDVPWALVHGDFAPRNVRVRRHGASAAALLVFDWEVAGWGMPGVDLGCVDLDLYHGLVQQRWPHLGEGALRRAACVGRLLRGGIAAVHWDAQKYAGNPHHGLDDMLVFRQRIIDELDELGWGSGTPRSVAGAISPRVLELPSPGAQDAPPQGFSGTPPPCLPGAGTAGMQGAREP